MSDLEQLQRQFSIPGIVKIEPGQGGLTRIAIATKEAVAHIYLHVAHVTHYSRRTSGGVLFLSGKSLFEPTKPIRGGVPIIFPWFGAKAGDPAAPQHGFARTAEWDLKNIRQNPNGSMEIVLELTHSNATLTKWPHEFLLRYTVTVGASLDLMLDVFNLSPSEPFDFEEALHTYLAVGDIHDAKVYGLSEREFLDKTDGAKRKLQPRGPIAITGETDRVYVNTTEVVTVSDPVLVRQLVVAKDGSQSTVLWNPWIAKAKAMADFGDEEWPKMVCVETANIGENAITLSPGKYHRLLARIVEEPNMATEERLVSRQWEMSAGAG